MAQGGSQQSWSARRRILAMAMGYRCHWCQIPTAATIEHVQARTRAGGNDLVENLRLACPHCNSAKNDEPTESWVARKGWRLPPPTEPFPSTVRQMLSEWYGETGKVQSQEGAVVQSGSTNARLIVRGDQVAVQVRSDKKDPWHLVRLGAEDHPKVVKTVWFFLYKHSRKPVKKKK